MSGLNTNPNYAKADEFYQTLLAAHGELSLSESVAMNSRLLLVLANHIGDMDILSQALEVATRAPNAGK